eukprot:6443333-Pyramimonas_sp.AAC.1
MGGPMRSARFQARRETRAVFAQLRRGQSAQLRREQMAGKKKTSRPLPHEAPKRLQMAPARRAQREGLLGAQQSRPPR